MRQIILDFQERPVQLPPNESVETLSLRGCCEWVDDEVLSELGSSGSIKTAFLFRCFKISDKALSEFVRKNGSALITLELSGCTHITDLTLRSISRYCKCLVNLDLTRCLEISDVGINYLSEVSESLESLLLYADSQLGESAYSAIAQLQRLKKLDLCGHANLSSTCLIEILKSCGSKVEYLNLSWCVNLSDDTLCYIIENELLGNIQSLSLFGIKNFSSLVMGKFIKYVSGVTTCTELDIRGIPSCATFTENDCAQLRLKMPQLLQWKLHH